MLNLRKAADVHSAGSLSNRLRARRFELFESLLSGYARPVRILDVGGTVAFWKQRGWAGREDVQITLLNLEAEPSDVVNIRSIAGSATEIQFEDKSFDVVFSNSVIEHLFTLEGQSAMAREVRRVASAYFVQTPNYWFPIEPHFHVPGWQWMPVSMRVALLRRRRCGWRGPCPDPVDARALVEEVRLMTKGELTEMFPAATL